MSKNDQNLINQEKTDKKTWKKSSKMLKNRKKRQKKIEIRQKCRKHEKPSNMSKNQ